MPPAVAERCAPDRFWGDLAHRRRAQVAAGVPVRLQGHDQGDGGRAGRPKPWFHFWISLQHPRAMLFAHLVAVIESLIALALIAGFARKTTYLSAIVFQRADLGDRRGVRRPLHLRCL